MGSGDDFLSGGVLAPSTHEAGASTVTLWIGRRDREPIVIQDDVELSLDFTDLAQAAGWTPQATVIAFTDAEPSLSQEWSYESSDGAERFYTPDPVTPGAKLRRLEIQLPGLATTKAVKATVGVGLKLGEQGHGLGIAIDVSPKPLRITRFRARPPIVVTGSSVSFEVACEQAVSWTIEEELAGKAPRVMAFSPSARPSATMNTSGVTSYRLAAKDQNGAQQTANVLVKVVDSPAWISGGAWWSPQQLAGLCVSPEGDAIYALVRSKDEASVWWSDDGFGRWAKLVAAPPAMVTSAPGVCVNVRKARKLIFAGGSKVDPGRTSSAVWTLDVTTRTWSPDGLSVVKDPWEPRMGHACVAARDSDGVDKIWVIGGVDAGGTALNDVHVSVDGITWESRAAPGWNPGNPADPAVAPGRCMFGATVKDSEIWIGGGFEEPDGRGVNDIRKWRIGAKAAEPIKTENGKTMHVTTDETWRLSALALATLDDEVYVAAVERRDGKYQATFSPMQGDDQSGWAIAASGSQPPWLPEAQFHHARIEAVTFNGCIWLAVQRYAGGHEIAASGLYYYLPPPKGSKD